MTTIAHRKLYAMLHRCPPKYAAFLERRKGHCKTYMQRLKQDPARYAEYLRKKAEWKRKKRALDTAEEQPKPPTHP